MSNPFHFFSTCICLTLIDEEWCAFQTEAARVGLDHYRKFTALPDIGPHQSFNRSTNTILRQFAVSGDESLLFVEDDCVWQGLGHLEAALSELPDDWDVVYLGANLLCWNREDEPKPERFSDHLFRVRQAWTTHAIGYNKKVVPFILENQPDFSDMMVDNWLSLQLPSLNAFVVAPMVAYQRPHVSSIWGKPEVDDYTDIFLASDERLK